MPRLLLAALAVLLAGCRNEAEAPPGARGDEAAEAPGPLVPEDLVFEDPAATMAGGGDTDEADSAEIVIHSGAEAPTVPVPAPPPPPSPPPAAGGAVGTCDVSAAEPVCFAFSGTGWTTEAAQAECGGAASGVFQSTACPTADRVGECVYLPDGDVARELVYTFYRPMDPLIAEGVCRGTFRAF